MMQTPASASVQPYRPSGATEYEAAVERYRYMLRTAPPDRLEQVHTEAFAGLTPAQHQQVLARLRDELPAGEYVASADDPRGLAA